VTLSAVYLDNFNVASSQFLWVIRKKKMKFRGMLILISISLAGCGLAGNAKPIPDNVSQATLTFEQDLAGNEALNGRWFDNAKCGKGDNSGITTLSWAFGYSKTLAIPADKKIYVAENIFIGGGGSRELCGGSGTCIPGMATCISQVSFLPISGRKYVSKLLMNNGCQTVIYELVDGQQVIEKTQEPVQVCESLI
jgi:hypothetical protein